MKINSQRYEEILSENIESIFETFENIESEKEVEAEKTERRASGRRVWGGAGGGYNRENKSVPLTPAKVLLEHYNSLSEYEYKEIRGYSEIYYWGKTKRVLSEPFCDSDLYYKCEEGDHIAYRYEVHKALGEGSFGLVLQCTDHKTQTQVAIKILRKGKKFDKIAEDEIFVLDSLKSHEGIVSKLTQFQFRGHHFIVYELLSIDLYNYLQTTNFSALSLSLIRRIATQLVISLKQIHSAGFIHCDLKPENILFKASNKSIIKIADFGSACQENSPIYSYLQSRFYRAPEVILQMNYSYKIDIWSLGCVLFELYCGNPLFPGCDEHDQMHRIIEVLGEVPSKLLIFSRRKEKINFKFSANGMKIVPGSRPLRSLIDPNESDFLSFLQGCLEIDPQKRLDSESALMHPWIQGSKVLRKK